MVDALDDLSNSPEGRQDSRHCTHLHHTVQENIHTMSHNRSSKILKGNDFSKYDLREPEKSETKQTLPLDKYGLRWGKKHPGFKPML